MAVAQSARTLGKEVADVGKQVHGEVCRGAAAGPGRRAMGAGHGREGAAGGLRAEGTAPVGVPTG